MIIVDLMTSFGEVQIEMHPTSVGFKIERLGGEVIVDVGKFSCAMSLPERRSRMWNWPRLHPAALALALAVVFSAELHTGWAEAGSWVLELSKRIFTPYDGPQ